MRYLGTVVLLAIFFVSAEKTYAADDTNTKNKSKYKQHGKLFDMGRYP